MCDFPVDLLVKQTIRSVASDPQTMGTLSSRIQNFHARADQPGYRAMNPDAAFYSLMTCPETVKYLFEHPRDYMQKIFENDNYKRSLAMAKSDSELKDIKNQILYKFIKELKDCRSQAAVEWAAFQHYMLFVYRKFVTPNPMTTNDPIPAALMKKLNEHSMSLTYEDKFQFFIRLVTLLREYVMMARENFDSIHVKVEPMTYIKCILNYYNAFCSAATKLTSLFSHFDHFLSEHFNMSWFRLHQKLFFQFFYAVASVQDRIAYVNQVSGINVPENKDLVADFRNIARDMIMLDRIWDRQLKKLAEASAQFDEKLHKELVKILKTNFWIGRASESSYNKDNQQCPELVPFFPRVLDDAAYVADRLIRADGTCICEDCMFAKFDHNVMNNLTNGTERIVLCYICNESVVLDNFGSHVVQEVEDKESRSDAARLLKWQRTPSMKKGLVKKTSSKLCKILSDTVSKKDFFRLNEDLNFDGENPNVREPINKRLLEYPLRESESIVRLANEYGKAPRTPAADKEPTIKLASEAPVFKGADVAATSKSALEKKCDDKKEKESFSLKFNVNNLTRPQTKLAEPKIGSFVATPKTSASVGTNTPKPAAESCVGHACGHKCKKDEGTGAANGSSKSSSSGEASDSARDKKCDCAYCEVFGSNVPTHVHKTNETRDRLRNRLTRRKERINEVLKTKAATAAPAPASPAPPEAARQKPEPASPPAPDPRPADKKENGEQEDDLERILDYIQGKPVDKVALAEKKAAKKARQRMKREEERSKREAEEEKRRAEEQRKAEEKRKEEERLKALAAKQTAKEAKKTNKAKAKKENAAAKEKEDSKKAQKGATEMEETIPAMVTIKRVVENDNSLPTVTITLKGSTPDQDKLLYTLVNGHASDDKEKEKGDKKKEKKKAEQPKVEKKSSKNNKQNKGSNVTTKEMKVTLTVDKSFHKGKEIKKEVPSKKEKKGEELKKAQENVELDIPSLKLPPGITITKVSGPLTNKNGTNGSNSSSSSSTPSYPSVPVNKSGVIVVDTEKLIQQQTVTAPNGKKNKKKKKKGAEKTAEAKTPNNNNGNMVTLRNPIFHTLQTKLVEKPEPAAAAGARAGGEQASITKGENGMVTIRRPSYMNPIDYGKETPISEYLGKLKPAPGHEPPPKDGPEASARDDRYDNGRSRLSTHDILWGLPGIEITKVNKNSVFNDLDCKKSCQAADVSIIPTSSNNGEKFNLDRDDWPFESVFAPKDILEDDLDAEERELEAFKRFCQQSIPPKHKEKVAHLNVKDIVLKKKNDVTYS